MLTVNSVTLDDPEKRPLKLLCLQCHTVLEPAASGRPRLYCSASCRQRAYRLRARGATHDEEGVIALARHLRDNVDQLWLLAQGWHPPLAESVPVLIAQLAADTAEVAARLADLEQSLPASGDETGDETGPSPVRGRDGR